jgi:hypothetical protein
MPKTPSGHKAIPSPRPPSSPTVSALGSADLEKVGTEVDEILVELDPELLQLFAAGLYRSPNKALEELATNSFDALADRVLVQLPENPDAPEATIWVADNGEGMDIEGLRNLWLIGRSPKRDIERPERPYIGKFGIGKLATFVLGTRLTYVSRTASGYLAVTMNFAELTTSHTPGSATPFARASASSTGTASPHHNTRDIWLKVRSLTEKQARTALSGVRGIGADSELTLLTLFGPKSEPTWTVAAIRGLLPLGRTIQAGRLRWVLSTALPLGGAFRVWLNCSLVEPERLGVFPIKQWIIGENDAVAERLGLDLNPEAPGVIIEGVGLVKGSCTVYDGNLTRGKSEAIGRSNGFFVRVRGRVINLDDPLFGLPPLSHTTFAAFRMEVEADGLNDLLRSSRESVQEGDVVERFRSYLHEKFNEVRLFHQHWIEKREFERLLSTRIDQTPFSLSRQPLLDAIKQSIEEGDELFLTEVPKFTSKSGSQAFISQLEELGFEKGLFEDVKLEPLGWGRPIALFDAGTRTLRINDLHPFFATYSSHLRSLEPWELLAATEVLTEAYLRDSGLSASETTLAMQRRDAFLRALVQSQQPTAALVARLLTENALDDAPMRAALQDAFACLGYEVTRLGGRSKPDGIAAIRATGKDVRKSEYALALYAVTSDRWKTFERQLKSGRLTKQADALNTQSTIVLVPSRPHAQSSLLTGEDLSRIRTQARNQHAVVITPEQLSSIVVMAATQGLSFADLRDLFVHIGEGLKPEEWFSSITSRFPEGVPIRELLDITWDIQRSRDERVQAGMIVERAKSKSLRNLKTSSVQEIFRTLRRLVGPLVSVEGLYISLEASPDQIVARIISNLNALPNGGKGSAFEVEAGQLPTPRIAVG